MIEADIVIPTLDRAHTQITKEYLRLVPDFVRNVHFIGPEYASSWPGAINAGLAHVPKGRDVILMDDDVFLMPNTFSKVEEMYDKADIFGFKLLYPDGRIQHAGGQFADGKLGHRFWAQDDIGQAELPVYLAHATTSLIYIKAHVLEKLCGMAMDYPGVQYEDVDFCIRALREGFKILYLPQAAIHMESASKKHLPRFNIEAQKNFIELQRRHLQKPELMYVLSSYPKPLEMEVVR
jgi:GT2 family glycosyltransferase